MPKHFFDDPAPGCIQPRKGGIATDRIVIHTMEGTFEGTRAFFKDPNRPVLTCAHYLVSKTGDVCQMVPDHQKCYHAGNYNSRSLGIEHEGYAKDKKFPAALLDASAAVVAALCEKYRIPVDREHIIGHSEVPGATHTDPGKNWPWDDFMERVRAAS